MYECTFERLDATDFTWSGYEVDEAKYRDLIRQRADEGWRFVQLQAD
jgi:hypothetical protein